MKILEYEYADGSLLEVRLGVPPYAVLSVAPPGVDYNDERSFITCCDTVTEALTAAAAEIEQERERAGEKGNLMMCTCDKSVGMLPPVLEWKALFATCIRHEVSVYPRTDGTVLVRNTQFTTGGEFHWCDDPGNAWSPVTWDRYEVHQSMSAALLHAARVIEHTEGGYLCFE